MKPGPQDKRYEKLYGALQDRADRLHQNNKAMIKWGSITMIALPFILFFIRWMTDSNKVAFLLIWVFCLFAIAAFLIAVEYMDHIAEGALRDITGGGERFDRLIQPSSKFTKRLTANVVTIMVLIGLCVIPCLYAWFNIFSNWDPYSPSATGRITVAVANEDEGADMVGMNVNVGEKLTDTLEANGTSAGPWWEARRRPWRDSTPGTIMRPSSSPRISVKTCSVSPPEISIIRSWTTTKT